MLRLNRGRIVGILLTTFIVYFLFLSSSNSNSDFRTRTEEGIARRHGVMQGDISDEALLAQTNQKLNDILANKEKKPAKSIDDDTGSKKTEQHPHKDGTDAKFTEGVAGRKTAQKEKPKYPITDVKEQQKQKQKQESINKPKDKTDDDDDDETKAPSDPAKDIAREKLQEYLKKPLIIFSKSYCPHSKRAKHLLLDLYKIVPAPLVVELDQLTERLPHPKSSEDHEDHSPAPTLGQKLQELLAEISGRRTVPNIIVGTTSIGGNDLIWEMHEEGLLADRIKALGGKRITSVEALDVEEGEEHKRRRRRR